VQDVRGGQNYLYITYQLALRNTLNKSDFDFNGPHLTPRKIHSNITVSHVFRRKPSLIAETPKSILNVIIYLNTDNISGAKWPFLRITLTSTSQISGRKQPAHFAMPRRFLHRSEHPTGIFRGYGDLINKHVRSHVHE
jgi:hypothetical protein